MNRIVLLHSDPINIVLAAALPRASPPKPQLVT